MKINALSALVLGAALFSLDAAANDGTFSSYETSGSWFSAIFHANDGDRARIGTNGADNSILVLDFYKDNTYQAWVWWIKHDKDKGTTVYSKPVHYPCELRIDLNPRYIASCMMFDDNNTLYLNLSGRLNERFIDESKGGNTLRIKVEVPGSAPGYLSYSLMGFTRTYYRAMSLSASSGSGYGYRDDSDYFR